MEYSCTCTWEHLIVALCDVAPLDCSDGCRMDDRGRTIGAGVEGGGHPGWHHCRNAEGRGASFIKVRWTLGCWVTNAGGLRKVQSHLILPIDERISW